MRPTQRDIPLLASGCASIPLILVLLGCGYVWWLFAYPGPPLTDLSKYQVTPDDMQVIAFEMNSSRSKVLYVVGRQTDEPQDVEVYVWDSATGTHTYVTTLHNEYFSTERLDNVSNRQVYPSSNDDFYIDYRDEKAQPRKDMIMRVTKGHRINNFEGYMTTENEYKYSIITNPSYRESGDRLPETEEFSVRRKLYQCVVMTCNMKFIARTNHKTYVFADGPYIPYSHYFTLHDNRLVWLQDGKMYILP